MIEKQVIALCLRKEFWDKAKNILSKDMFPKEYSTIFDTINSSQQKYEVDLTVDELLALHRDRYPAMPESTRNNIEEEIENLKNIDPVKIPEVDLSGIESSIDNLSLKIEGMESKINEYEDRLKNVEESGGGRF